MNTLDKETLIGTFLYDQDGDTAQTFEIPVSITLCNKHMYIHLFHTQAEILRSDSPVKNQQTLSAHISHLLGS